VGDTGISVLISLSDTSASLLSKHTTYREGRSRHSHGERAWRPLCKHRTYAIPFFFFWLMTRTLTENSALYIPESAEPQPNRTYWYGHGLFIARGSERVVEFVTELHVNRASLHSTYPCLYSFPKVSNK
jgi:hypothetical protein